MVLSPPGPAKDGLNQLLMKAVMENLTPQVGCVRLVVWQLLCTSTSGDNSQSGSSQGSCLDGYGFAWAPWAELCVSHKIVGHHSCSGQLGTLVGPAREGMCISELKQGSQVYLLMVFVSAYSFPSGVQLALQCSRVFGPCHVEVLKHAILP
jgi:hypothetical protein